MKFFSSSTIMTLHLSGTAFPFGTGNYTNLNLRDEKAIYMPFRISLLNRGSCDGEGGRVQELYTAIAGSAGKVPVGIACGGGGITICSE